MEPKFTALEVLADKWWIGVISLAVSLAVTPVVRWIAYRTKIVDRPDDLLKPHGRPVAYLGGLAMYAGLLAGLIGYLFIMPDLAQHWGDLRSDLPSLCMGPVMANPIWRLASIMLSCLVITVVGLLDDVYVMKPRQKVYGQVLAAAILVLGGVADQMARIVLVPLMDFPPYWLVLPVSSAMCLVLVVAACNATNLLDGLDGLCGGVTGIIALGFLALAIWLAMWDNFPGTPGTDGVRLCLCLAMAGAVLGFLPYNLPPASIFMGDAGSMLLGFFVATMMAAFCQEGNARWFIAAWVVFALPVLDTGLAVIRRLLSHKSIFEGDRSHLYDQLVDRGLSVKQVVALFYALSAAAAVIGVVGSIMLRFRQAVPIYLVLLVLVVTICALLGMMTPPPHQPKDRSDKDLPGKGQPPAVS